MLGLRSNIYIHLKTSDPNSECFLTLTLLVWVHGGLQFLVLCLFEHVLIVIITNTVDTVDIDLNRRNMVVVKLDLHCACV